MSNKNHPITETSFENNPPEDVSFDEVIKEKLEIESKEIWTFENPFIFDGHIRGAGGLGFKLRHTRKTLSKFLRERNFLLSVACEFIVYKTFEQVAYILFPKKYTRDIADLISRSVGLNFPTISFEEQSVIFPWLLENLVLPVDDAGNSIRDKDAIAIVLEEHNLPRELANDFPELIPSNTPMSDDMKKTLDRCELFIFMSFFKKGGVYAEITPISN